MENLREHIVMNLVISNSNNDNKFSVERLLKGIDSLLEYWKESAPQILLILSTNHAAYPYLDKMGEMKPLSTEWRQNLTKMLEAVKEAPEPLSLFSEFKEKPEHKNTSDNSELPLLLAKNKNEHTIRIIGNLSVAIACIISFAMGAIGLFWESTDRETFFSTYTPFSSTQVSLAACMTVLAALIVGCIIESIQKRESNKR